MFSKGGPSKFSLKFLVLLVDQSFQRVHDQIYIFLGDQNFPDRSDRFSSAERYLV